jgi:hypothetical protein
MICKTKKGNMEKHEENDKTETKKHGAVFSFIMITSITTDRSLHIGMINIDQK